MEDRPVITIEEERDAPSGIRGPPIARNPNGFSFLEISKQGLMALSPQVSRFPNLTGLYVDNNQLRSLPSSLFTTCVQLVHLDASHNVITTIDPQIAQLERLKSLLLNDNKIQSVPHAVGMLFRCKKIDLTNNPITNVPANLIQDTSDSVVKFLRDSSNQIPEPSSRNYLLINERVRGHDISVLCYNVLSDLYATAKMYGYTPAWGLDWKYRKNLIFDRLVESGADVICLQELQMEEFNTWLQPELAQFGYVGVFKAKSRAKTMNRKRALTVDGCATFYLKDKFRSLAENDIEFNTLAMQRNEAFPDKKAFERLIMRDNVALVVMLEFLGTPKEARGKGRRCLLVANTHIHFDPKFSDVKLIQVQVLLEECERMIQTHQRKVERGKREPPVAALILGDFNSLPDQAAYTLLNTGRLDGSHPEFKGYSFGKYTDAGLLHSFNLSSAYATVLGQEPAFTNYTADFKGVIDYIWATPNLKCVSVLEGVTEEEASKRVALPNDHFPSDHIRLAARFCFQDMDAPSGPSPPGNRRRQTYTKIG